MHYLPFSMLVDSKGDSLIKRYEILVEPSASVWKLCLDKKKRNEKTFAGYALGDFAIGFTEGKKDAVRGTIVLSPDIIRDGLPPLPETKVEVEAIGALLSRAYHSYR